MEDHRLPTTNILPLDLLEIEPGEVHVIWINLYKCPFCEKITGGIGFNGVSVDEYAVGEDGTLYRKFEPALDEDQDVGCECGRGVWITSRDKRNISTILGILSEEQLGSQFDNKFLQ